MDRSKQIKSLVKAFGHAVSIGVNSRLLKGSQIINPEPLIQINDELHKSLKQHLKTSGDISGLLKNWSECGEVITFYGTSGKSALEVISKFTQRIFDGRASMLPQEAEGWTPYKVWEQQERLLVQLELEARNSQAEVDAEQIKEQTIESKAIGVLYEMLASGEKIVIKVIAKKAGCSRQHLYKLPNFMNALKILKEHGKQSMLVGSKYPDENGTGTIEAWED